MLSLGDEVRIDPRGISSKQGRRDRCLSPPLPQIAQKHTEGMRKGMREEGHTGDGNQIWERRGDRRPLCSPSAPADVWVSSENQRGSRVVGCPPLPASLGRYGPLSSAHSSSTRAATQRNASRGCRWPRAAGQGGSAGDVDHTSLRHTDDAAREASRRSCQRRWPVEPGCTAPLCGGHPEAQRTHDRTRAAGHICRCLAGRRPLGASSVWARCTFSPFSVSLHVAVS